MKTNPIILELVKMLGGPSLFPHLTEGQIHELIEERLADLLAEIHAFRRHEMIKDYLLATNMCSAIASQEIAAKLSSSLPRPRFLPSTVDAQGVAFYPGVERVVSVELEKQAREAKELWYRIPPPISPLEFQFMMKPSAKHGKRRATHA